MKPKASEIYVLGLDFGSDSVRAVLVDTKDGRVIGEGVSLYKRWAKGMFSDFSESRFRHHPLDYQESITEAVRAVVAAYPQESSHIAAMSIDTTASTPCFVDENLVPLSLKPEFAENPNAMFVLWKDHTATEDAAEFEAACNRSVPDYSMCSGHKYSPEAFWSKALHILRVAPEVRDSAFTMLELCDWLPAMLTGCHDINDVKMSHCCAAQKLLWNKDWGGFPPEEFFESIDPLLLKVRRHLPPYNYTPDCAAGVITHEWAERLGLPEGVIVGAGNIDSHSGSFGAGVKERTLIMSYGTSSAYTTVISHKDLDHVIEGALGQVDGLIVPDLIGIENGLSAFGDVYAWFKRLVMEPVKPLILSSDAISDECKAALIRDMEDRIMGDGGEPGPSFRDRLFQWAQGSETGYEALGVHHGAETRVWCGGDFPRIGRGDSFRVQDRGGQFVGKRGSCRQNHRCRRNCTEISVRRSDDGGYAGQGDRNFYMQTGWCARRGYLFCCAGGSLP